MNRAEKLKNHVEKEKESMYEIKKSVPLYFVWLFEKHKKHKKQARLLLSKIIKPFCFHS